MAPPHRTNRRANRSRTLAAYVRGANRIVRSRRSGIRKFRGRAGLGAPPANGSVARGIAPVDEFFLSALVECSEPRGLACEQGREIVRVRKRVADARRGY